MLNKRTIVIIGTGVTGLSTAYRLAKKQAGRIIVFDKGKTGDGSSSRAAGIITGLLWSKTGIEARKVALQLFRELSSELNGYCFQDVGTLNLLDQQAWEQRKLLLPLYEQCGAPFEILTAKEMRTRWPDLYPSGELVGLFDPLGGYSEPDEYLSALKIACSKLGVDIREEEPVKDFVLRSGSIAGIITEKGLIEADAVISTVYGWTNVLFSRLGLKLPVKTVVHQRYVTEPVPHTISIPCVNADPFYGYCRPAAGGRLLFGIETSDREEWRVSDMSFHLDVLLRLPDPRYTEAVLREKIKENFSSYFPPVKNLRWESSKTGLLTFSMDGEPILGSVAEIPGLFVGVAFHSGGFAYNPVSGLLLAELVTDGKTSVNIDAFSPSRFSNEQTEKYLAQTVQQKNVVKRRH